MGLDNPLHIAFILVILLLLFGAKRIPEIGRSLGSGLREFKQSINGESTAHDHEHAKLNAGAPPPVKAPPAQSEPARTEQR